MEIESVQMYYKQSIITIIMHHFMQTDRHNNSSFDFYSYLMLGLRAQMTKNILYLHYLYQISLVERKEISGYNAKH
jgi:hypothetical protein